MIGIETKCPHCGHKQFIPIQIIKDDRIIVEHYIVCSMCVDAFKIELQFKVKKEI